MKTLLNVKVDKAEKEKAKQIILSQTVPIMPSGR